MFPRLTSSTRIVLVLLNIVLSVATLYALFTWSEHFTEVLALFWTSIGTVIGFFFWQRETEHKTFAENNLSQPKEWI